MKTYKYTDASNTVVHIVDEDGVPRSSCLVATMPEGVTPLPAETSDETKARRWLEIKAERDSRKEGGALVMGKWFHTDADSRIQQLGLVMMGVAVPAVQWKTMDGSFITMSPALATGIFQGVAALDMTLFSIAEAHRAAVDSSTDPASYNISVNWPAHYTA